ncbi:MAG TPA: AAA family ATPase [Candidatus Nanoarchaeia archaeon]|nr:AAA family ATPase [Candidatus Nanoarchaeia archaeon]
MGMFKDMLGSQESLFKDHIPLDYDYLPKLIPYREPEQRHIASCIKPLLMGRNGRNLFLYGPPGVGKTAACKHLLKELEEETDEVIPIYINCWQRNTTYKAVLEMCEVLEYRFIQNKKTDELFKDIKNILNKKSVILIFDEVDKLEETDILYYVLEEILRKTVILITNYKEWIAELDTRIKSRLTAELLEFKPYNAKEVEGILRIRMQYAFVEGTFSEAALQAVVQKTVEEHDLRMGLYLMREAGNIAEDKAMRSITLEHVQIAIGKLDDFSIKKTDELDEECKFIMGVIKGNSGKKIGELFRLYQETGGKQAYKSFQRKISKLAENRFITIKKLQGGAEGMTTIVTHLGSMRKLTEF